MRAGLSGGDAEKYRMVPLNFDVEAFTHALQDLGAGELGSYFPTGFNGIVYIGSFWPGATARMSTSTSALAPPDLWPRANSTNNTGMGNWPTGAPVSDIAMPLSSAASGAENNRLPNNLCGDNASLTLPATGGANATRFSGRPGGAYATFIVPKCEATPGVPLAGEGSTTASSEDQPSRPNALRIIHAWKIDPTVFPKGLSIVTNGPVYLLGDTNAFSQGKLPANQGGDWRPLMVAGDATTFVSNAWTDNDFDWSDAAGSFSGTRNAPTNTTYLVATIAGNVETSSTDWGGGVNNFPRFIEKWSASAAGAAPLVHTYITGSLVSAFRSVYQWQPWDTSAGSVMIYYPPQRDWAYDINLALPANQPPGTPSFFVQATERWQRD
jgi:hypothetical protein